MVASPGIALRTLATCDEQGRVSYAVFWGIDTVVAPSRVGLVFQGDTLLSGFAIESFEKYGADSLWDARMGVRDSHAGMRLRLLHSPSQCRATFDVRAMARGVAVRMEQTSCEQVLECRVQQVAGLHTATETIRPHFCPSDTLAWQVVLIAPTTESLAQCPISKILSGEPQIQ